MKSKYTEKHIHTVLKSKLKNVTPGTTLVSGDHDKINIYVDGKFQARVKLPNSHPKLFPDSKLKKTAESLMLSMQELFNLLDCPMSGPEYLNLLRDRTSP